MQKAFIRLLLVATLLLNIINCADQTAPLADAEPGHLKYYFEYGDKYQSTINDLESKRLAADIQRKLSNADVQALRGGSTILLIGNVATSVDIVVAKSLAVNKYSDDNIINKLAVDSLRSNTQVNQDNNITSKTSHLIAKYKLKQLKYCCFNNEVFIVYPKNIDSSKITILVQELKKNNKTLNSVQTFAY